MKTNHLFLFFLLLPAVALISFLFPSSAGADIAYWKYILHCHDSPRGTTVELDCLDFPGCEAGDELYGCPSKSTNPCFLIDNIEWRDTTNSSFCNYIDPVTGQCLNEKHRFSAYADLPFSCEQLDFDFLCTEPSCPDRDWGCSTYEPGCRCGTVENFYRDPGGAWEICGPGYTDELEQDIEDDSNPWESFFQPEEETDSIADNPVIPSGGISCSLSYKTANLSIIGFLLLMLIICLIGAGRKKPNRS